MGGGRRVLLRALAIGYAAWRGCHIGNPSQYLGLGLARQHHPLILDTGQASPTHMGELRNVETKAPLYYPSAFHALGAVLAQLTGSAPTTAYTLSSLAAAVWLFPLSAGLLTWQLLNGRTTLWRTAGASATAAALSASFTAVPYVEFDTAAMPNLVAYGGGAHVRTGHVVAGAPLAYPVGGAGNRWGVLRSYHRRCRGGDVRDCMVVVGRAAESRGRSREQRTAQRFPDAPGHRGSDAGGTAPAIPRVLQQAEIITGHTFVTHMGRKRALFDAIVQHTRHLNDYPIQNIIIGLAGIGFLMLPVKHLVAGCGLATADCLDRALLGAIRRSDRCPDR